jgi:hypothetical protein
LALGQPVLLQPQADSHSLIAASFGGSAKTPRQAAQQSRPRA